MGALLFHFTEWLRSTFLVDLALRISDTSLSLWMVTHFWVVPILQTIHILAIAGSFAAVLMIALRVYGMAGHATLAETSRRYARVLWWSLAVLVASGIGMIIAEPVRVLINPIFWIKMMLVIIGVAVAIGFARSLRRKLAGIPAAVTTRAEVAEVAGGPARATAAFLVVLWCAIMFCGRWIAYAPV